jgi:hypothetical protein
VDLRVVRPQLDRLLEVGDRLDQRRRLRGVGGGLHQPLDREVVAAGQPQVAGGLGGAHAGGAGERLVQERAAGVVEVGERGLAQQVVAEAEASLGAAEEAAVERGEHRLGWGQRGELDAVERAAGDGGELGGAAGGLVERGDRGAHEAAQRGRRRVLAAPGGACALERQQRIAVGGGDHVLALRRGERRDLADERLELSAGQRLERDLPHRHTAAASSVGERVDRVAPRGHTACEHEQQRQPLDPPREVGDQLERRRIGEVDVVEQQHERPVGGGVLGQLDRRLEQPRAGELGRHLGRRDPRSPEPRRQRRRQPRQLLGPAGLGGRRLELARQPGQQLHPRPERRPTAEVGGGAAGGARPVRAGAAEQLERQPRLPDPGLTGDDRDPAGPRSYGGPEVRERGEVVVAADERRPFGGGGGPSGGRRRRPSGLGRRLLGGGRGRRSGGAIRAHRRGKRAGLRRRRQAERAPQAVGKAVVGG